MRTVRRVVAVLLGPVLLVVATVVGTLAGVLFTPPGHALLARVATQWITGAVAGVVEIGMIRGNIWNHIELHQVTVRDQRGVVVLSAPRLSIHYLFSDLIAGRVVFRGVDADSLRIHLVQRRGGRWNYEEVFHLGEGKRGGTSSLVSLTSIRLTHAAIQLDVPTGSWRPRLAASRNGRVPVQSRIDTTADGLMKVYTFSDVDAALPLLRISTPRNDPLRARISSLRAHINDPDVQITGMAGEVVAAGDSLRFNFDSVMLPSSVFKGAGSVRWPNDSLMFDFTLDAPRVALRDLWWIQPDFPDWEGRGHVIAKSHSGSLTDFKLEHLALGNGRSGVAGDVTVITDNARGLGMRGLDMQLRNTPIDVLRPYLDTLPVSGTLTGHLLANGFLDALRLGGDLVFADALVPGTPMSHLRVSGVTHFGGNEGAIFEQFRLDQSTLALGTVDRLVPSLLISGELRLTGQLDGPWQNAQFVGTAEHATAAGALSRMIGKVRLDSRGLVLGVALDADLDPLSFDALRSGYPSLPSRGRLTGHVLANGNLDSLDIVTNLTGEIGTIGANGRITVNAPHYGADSLILDLRRLDLEALLGQGTPTSLNGRITARGTADSGVAPQGTLSLALDRSRVGGATVDAVTGVVHADHGLLTVDTGTVIWSAGRLDAHGTLGWTSPDSGTLTVAANATSLTPFDSLIRQFTGVAADTMHPQVFEGQASASLEVRGAIDAATITGTVTAHQVALDTWHATQISASLRADSSGRRFHIDATADTIGKATHVANRLHVVIDQTPASLGVAASASMVALNASAGGSWQAEGNGGRLRLDSLTLASPHQEWRLAEPARIAFTGSRVTLSDTLHLRSADGSGDVRVRGTLPSDVPGDLDAHISGLDLLSVFGVLQRDTTALDGIGSLDLHLAGTRDAPTFNGAAAIDGPVLGEAHFPALRTTFDYAASRLRSSVSLWSAGEKVLDGSVSLPLDLSLNARLKRKLAGELQISAVGDSVDMIILSAITPAVTNPTGRLSLNMHGAGTWESPRLTGVFAIHDGGLTLPSLGSQRYAPINGQARFVADSMVIDSLMVMNDVDDWLTVKGGIRLEQLTSPTMNLNLSAHDFLAIDVPADLTVHATGEMRLFGPILHPVLTGDDVELSRSVIYFDDIVTKAIIDLEDPENMALIDTVAYRRQGLANELSIRFLDSLAINGLGLHIGSGVWLRSSQANIQLEGDLVVYKDRKVYGLTGLLNAPRGTYTLQIGPIESDFVVDQGTVQYFGTPDLNADLSIRAHHQVRTVDGDQFNVVATVTGSMLDPTVNLTAPGRTLTDRDLVSYVLFGRSEFQLTGGQQSLDFGSAPVTLAIGALTSEFRRQIVSSGHGGFTPSTLTIHPGLSTGGVISSSSLTQIAAGWQFGSRWFVTFDAGFCIGAASAGLTQQRNFGASLEYRMSRQFRFQASADPVQTCITNRATDAFTRLNRYQLGGDLLWQRDY